jgi:hypothetical protein
MGQSKPVDSRAVESAISRRLSGLQRGSDHATGGGTV